MKTGICKYTRDLQEHIIFKYVKLPQNELLAKLNATTVTFLKVK